MDTTSESESSLRTRLRQQEVVAELGQRALDAGDIDRLMREATTAVAETLGTEYCGVIELLSDEEEGVLRQGVGWRDGVVGTATVSADPDSQAGVALRTDEPVVVEDHRAETRFSAPGLLRGHDAVSGICVGVGSSEGPWGVLGAYAAERREFDAHEVEFVRSVADVLGSAIARTERERALREAGRRDEARKRALEESERRYRTLVEQFPNGAVALVDDDLRYRTVGGTPLDVAGVTAEEVRDRPVGEILPPNLADELVPRYEAALDGTEDTFEIELGERIYQFRVVPVRDNAGDVFAALGMSQDITEREEVQRKLEASERRHRTLVENFPNGSVGLFDENLEYTAVGGQLLDTLDVDPEDRIGRSITELHPEDLLEDIEPYFRAALDGEASTFDVEYRGRYLHARTLPVRNADGEVDAGMLVVQDDTERRRYERRLEQYREYTNRILDAIDDVFYVLDADGNLQRWNRSVCEVTGYSDAEIASMHALDVFAEDQQETIANAIAEVLETGSTQEEAEILTKDGERVPYEFVASKLDDPDGDPVVVGVGRDITRQKERERALEESEAKFRMLTENLEEMVWISDPGTRDVLYLNPAYEEIYGRDREPIYDDPATFLEAVHPEDRRRVETAYDEIPEEGIDEEFRIVRPDGEIRWLDARAGVVRNEGEERIVGIAEDVTERVERERKLEESERRYRTLVEDFPDGAVALFDEDLRYTAAGGQLLKEDDIDPEDRIGASIRELYPDDLVEQVEPYFRAALDGEASTFETEYAGWNLFNRTLPVRNADDEVYAGMLVVRNVTKRREYERKLEESNERLEQFAYAASHDLQEPLRMVSSYLRLLERRYEDALDEDGEEFLEFAVDGADRMREMIEGLLQYSRVDTRGNPFEAVELDAVFENVRRDLQMKISESDADITAERLPRVYGDRSQLKQVLQNLLANAIDYSGDDPPRAHVSAERDGEEWVVSVRDEGIGIDPADADRVFEVFQSLHAPDEHSGTGIGLALCERIVERHGGRIWVESEPGEGATFSFTLPTVASASDD
ncbi:PAS domain S-box protein [Halopelagius longus]|uniref:histidine kinase n=1 Tax=Halopelagius longus TaxID=1236180 RepID=A0A1H0YCN0_9EURY|nr:PAS domain S-box protein [Halopelagius longus]RDI72412.1 PAS domain S-box protein [Halopelagius longus]SDQ12830.1 PAS domain S-box-containing protein [Halopelagius longus]